MTQDNAMCCEPMQGDAQRIMDEVLAELRRAQALYPQHPSLEHSWAVLREECDELWDEIKRSRRNRPAIRREAIQVIAMGIRLILDGLGKEGR
jgi:hypothetical protein